MQIQGRCAEKFAALGDAFEALFAQHGDTGAGLAVVVDGEPVVELWGGLRDRAASAPWENSTVANVWSTTKGVTAACVSMLVSRGQLAYDAPVSFYWPDFAAAGKAEVTVAQLLSHQAGLCGFRRPVDVGTLYDSAAAAAELATQEPFWSLGEGSGYHAISVGFLLDELVRRVDGRDLNRFVAEELRAGCGLNITMGLPADRYDSAATLYAPALDGGGSAAVVPELDTIQLAALANPVMEPTLPNTPGWREACIPSANGFADARSLATLYAALASDGRVADQELVDRATLTAMREVQCSGIDRVLGLEARWGCGFLINSLGLYGPNPEAFGHSGWGGSFAFGDPKHGLGCAYVMNQMGNDLVGDPRAVSIVNTLYNILNKPSTGLGNT